MVSDAHDDYLPGDGLPRRELDVSHLGRRLAAHRRWLIGPALVCFVVSVIAVNVISPRYTAETKVLIESQQSYFTRVGNADTQQQPLPDDEAVQSQVQLASSRDVAREAIRQLDLKGNSEFDPLADGIGPVTRLLVMLGLERDPLRTPPEERILPTYFDRLTVFPVTKSRVLTIEFESKNPDLAAKAANTIADLYIGVQSAAKRDAAHAAAESLGTLVANLQAKSAEAEAKAQAFRSQSGLLVGTNNTTFSSQQLTDLTTQLAQARSAEAEAQAKAKLIRDMVKAGRTSVVPDVANNDLIRRLSEQRAAIQAEVALQSRTLLPGHPRMQELNAQLSDLEGQIRTATDKVVRGLDSDARMAQARVDNMTAAINSQKEVIGATGPDQVKLSELDLNARLLKDQLEFNTSKYQEALARENAGSNPADARIISRAVAPQLPTFPKKLPTITIMTLAGAILSLGILIARELLSGRAFVQTEPVTNVPISLADERSPNRAARVDELDESAFTLKPSFAPAPSPAVSETVPSRTVTAQSDPLSAVLNDLARLKQPDLALRILVLNASPDAPSDTVSVRLGRALSRSARTIAVDLGVEMRRSMTDHAALSQDISPKAKDMIGLVELLDGQASFAEVIHRDPSSRLHFIPAGSMPLDPADRSADEDGVSNVLDALAETYDYVLMSGLGATEEVTASVASDHADALVLVAEPAAKQSELDACRVALQGGEPDAAPVFILRLADEDELGGLIEGAAA